MPQKGCVWCGLVVVVWGWGCDCVSHNFINLYIFSFHFLSYMSRFIRIFPTLVKFTLYGWLYILVYILILGCIKNMEFRFYICFTLFEVNTGGIRSPHLNFHSIDTRQAEGGRAWCQSQYKVPRSTWQVGERGITTHNNRTTTNTMIQLPIPPTNRSDYKHHFLICATTKDILRRAPHHLQL